MLPSQDVVKWQVESGLFMPKTKLNILLLRTNGDKIFIGDYTQHFPDRHYIHTSEKYRLHNSFGESRLVPYKKTEQKSNWPATAQHTIPKWGITDIAPNIRAFGSFSDYQVLQNTDTGYFIAYTIRNGNGDSRPYLLQNFKTSHEQFFDWYRSGCVVLPYNTADASLKKISEFGLSQNKRLFADELHAFIQKEFGIAQKQK